MRPVRMRRLLKYVTGNGRCPYDDWLNGLKDKRTYAIVATRLNRIVQGNFGLCKKLGDEVWELKFDFGPGLRVYFAENGDTIVVLLCGGDKSTQHRDIEKAKRYWAEYKKE
jgi:putative addiction module killer protein